MSAQEIRGWQKALVGREYERLKVILAGDFCPGYFNSPRARDAELAEQNGLSICDAMLGYILDSNPDKDSEVRARELINRVSKAVVSSEVKNECHNLHGACALMLDALHIPVVVVWGSVYASDQHGHSFFLNAWDGPVLPGYRPGHSWLLTPHLRVADIALVHQSDVRGNYDALRSSLPPVITVDSSEESEPDVNWLQLQNGRAPSADQFAKSTRYHDIIGWSQHDSGPTTVRYIPGAVSMPCEAEMGDVRIKIGGLSPREFFNRHAKDLFP